MFLKTPKFVNFSHFVMHLLGNEATYQKNGLTARRQYVKVYADQFSCLSDQWWFRTLFYSEIIFPK